MHLQKQNVISTIVYFYIAIFISTKHNRTDFLYYFIIFFIYKYICMIVRKKLTLIKIIIIRAFILRLNLDKHQSIINQVGTIHVVTTDNVIIAR